MRLHPCLDRLESISAKGTRRGVCGNPHHVMYHKVVKFRTCLRCAPFIDVEEVLRVGAEKASRKEALKNRKRSREMDEKYPPLDSGERWLEGAASGSPNESSSVPPERLQKASGEPPTITPDGTLIYDQTGWEPPSCPPGYQRKSDDASTPDAWVLEPRKPLCKHIKLNIGSPTSCGYRRVIPTCTYKGKSSKIGMKKCPHCKNKEPRDVETPPDV